MNDSSNVDIRVTNGRYGILKTTLVVIAIFTFIALMSSFMFTFERRPVPWPMALLRPMIGWNSWAVTIPAALWLAWKYPVAKNPLWQTIVTILIVSFIAISIKAGVLEFLNGLIKYGPPSRHTFFERVSRTVFSSRILFEFLIFWFILALAFAFQNYQNFQDREMRSKQLEFELAQAKLNSLQMQLQPHFLFNTLNSISSLLRDQESEHSKNSMASADQMITSLSEMFRHTLKTVDQQTVPLRDELLFLENYVSIEKTRFADRMNVEMDIGGNLKSRLVPSFFLQPIVENAVRHGIARLSENGIIRIRIYKDDGNLCFVIQDNGTCTQEELNQSMNKGMGLTNTQQRLQHMYGDSCVFQIGKNNQQETEVFISIPDLYQPEEEDHD